MKNPMRKMFTIAVLFVGLVPTTTAGPSKLKVTVDQDRLATLSPIDQQQILCIAERVEDIAAMDRNALSREERRALRSELNTLKCEAEAYNQDAGGTVIYISGAGLILLIILILILT